MIRSRFFVTLGACGLYNYGVSHMPVSLAGAYVNLIPVFPVILGWIVLGEHFTIIQYVACAFVFIGVLLSQGHTRAPGRTMSMRGRTRSFHCTEGMLKLRDMQIMMGVGGDSEHGW